MPAWPEPPEPPRIKFVRTLASERDLGKEAGFADELLAALAGRKPPADHLAQPVAIAVSDDGNRVYVSDFSQRLIYVFDGTQKRITRIGEEQQVGRPFGIALDAQEHLYVTDQAAKLVRIFDRAGRPLGTLGAQNLARPTGIAIDRQRGRIYVADSALGGSQPSRVKIFDVQGRLLGSVGENKDGEAYRYFPTYLALDGDGNLYVADTMKARVVVFDPQGNHLKQLGSRGDAFGMFDKPKGIALDGFGNVYVVDSSWSTVQIFNQRGEVLLFFGGRSRYPGFMQNPTGIAIGRDNRIYVADTFNFRVNVYELVNTTAADSYLASPGGGPEGGEREARRPAAAGREATSGSQTKPKGGDTP
jgi:DNA-binding beta-propeller fold protein YncE